MGSFRCVGGRKKPKHGNMSVCFVFRKKRCKVVVFSPSDDAYYYWLMVVGSAVLYNWTLLVVRSAICRPCPDCNNCCH